MDDRKVAEQVVWRSTATTDDTMVEEQKHPRRQGVGLASNAIVRFNPSSPNCHTAARGGRQFFLFQRIPNLLFVKTPLEHFFENFDVDKFVE